jgi:CRISPR-associated protein Cmr2
MEKEYPQSFAQNVSSNPALLATKLLNVQDFISNSRKLSDLWASSHIFSVLVAEGLNRLCTQESVIIFPDVEENPLFNSVKGTKPNNPNKIRIASLPSTSLLLVPADKAEELAKIYKKSIEEKWYNISKKAKASLEESGLLVDELIWDDQVRKCISMITAWIEFISPQAYEEIEETLPKDLIDRQRNHLNSDTEISQEFSFYPATYELLGSILNQDSRIWHSWEEMPKTGKKCLMCGRGNALVERREDGDYYTFYEEKWQTQENQMKYILKEKERLCAVCMIKRIYTKTFEELFGTSPPAFRCVAEIAGKQFIDRIKGDKDMALLLQIEPELIYLHEWEQPGKSLLVSELISQAKRTKKGLLDILEDYYKNNSPCKYYAVLMMDGDKIGEKISRITILEDHVKISQFMEKFSVDEVPRIIENSEGFLVYSGGDDILAFFPIEKVLESAKKLQDYFAQKFLSIPTSENMNNADRKASMSAGITFAHYSYPLYDVIEKARKAEKKAKKKYDRNAFCMTFIKRSGEIYSAGGKWSSIDPLDSIAHSIIKREFSPGFIFDLITDLEQLEGNMLKSDIKRLLKRRKFDSTPKERIEKIHLQICQLIDEYSKQEMPILDIGKSIRILYDAFRGERE